MKMTWSRSAFLGAMIVACVLVLVSYGAGRSGEQSAPQGVGEKVVVASHMAYPPFEFSARGGPKGFDIDLMNEIADRAGFEVEYRDVPFDNIMQGITVNHFDAAISAMTITDRRDQQADFSDPYYNVSEALVVRSDSGVKSTEDLSGKVIGARFGITEQSKVSELIHSAGAVEIRTFETTEEMFAALREGSLDGVIHDLPAAQDEVDDSGRALELIEVIPTGEQYGIAFPKDSALDEPVNEALAEIKEDGTYDEIYEKWIGRPPEEIP